MVWTKMIALVSEMIIEIIEINLRCFDGRDCASRTMSQVLKGTYGRLHYKQ